MRAILMQLAVLTAFAAGETTVDVAPFGQPLIADNFTGVQWPEWRRVTRVEVVFKDGAALPAAGDVKLEYWQHSWNGGPIRRYTEQGAGGVGWAPTDDWYNGKWKTAAADARLNNRTLVFTFASSKAEFPNLKGSGIVYRPTLKLRVSVPAAQVAQLRAYSDSIWRESELAIRFEGRDRCDDPLEVHNGRMIAKSAAAMPGGCLVRAKVAYAFQPEDAEADRTIVTVRSPRDPFSFAVDEAERGDRIFIKDFGVLVTRAADPVTIGEMRRSIEESGARTVYDRVGGHAEQTLSGAWRDMPIKPPYYFVLACEGGRQRFRLDPNGDLAMTRPALPRGRRTSTEFLWPDGIRFRFGLPETAFAERSLADGYLPIVTTRWLEGDLIYEQEAFADVLAANLNSAPPMQADDPVVAILRLRVTNAGPESRAMQLELTSHAQARRDPSSRPFETLRVENGLVTGSYQGRDVPRYVVDTRGAGALSNGAGGVLYRLDLAPGKTHTLYFKVPFATPSAADVERLRSISPEREREEVAQYWRKRVAAGAKIRTPEPWLNDFYKAQLAHLLINDEREIGSDRYAARVGSFHYGAFGNESIMMVSDLDRRGYGKEAERSLELFLHYQGSEPLPGTFRSSRGVLNGAGGYEAGGYNQHHGWILWGLGEHWWYTRDRAWMDRAAPRIAEACNWIRSERAATKILRGGKRVPEYGLLPAGSLEDVTDFWFWLSTNCFNWWGMKNAAAALQDAGYPEGAALVKEAADYGGDILAAYREAAVLSPVVRLRDGTYVPHFPSNVYTRGRTYGWLRETLEGAIMLPITRLLDPNSREAKWILQDFEDNLYISDRYGYSIPNFDLFWFSRGGFSMQPNLLHGPLPYFYRDDIKHFLRAYFNPFAAGYEPTLRMLPEHPLPELGYFRGDHFKTSDESQSTYWLRLMFASELDGTLWLGRGLPRYWLKEGETIGIENAATYFGRLSYEIRSAAGRIAMTLEPPDRNPPARTVVRFRHPEEKAIRSVTVKGAAWTDFDPRGDVRLPGKLRGKTEIVANY